jgi:hypothetical protein
MALEFGQAKSDMDAGERQDKKQTGASALLNLRAKAQAYNLG